ncbi:MAG: CHAD domain-containing protein [Acetobacteraceae bacterium]
MPTNEIAASPGAGGGTLALRPAHTEVELKLLGDCADLARLTASPLVGAHAKNHGRVRHLKAIYYDTETGGLERAGVAFRVRKVGRRLVATVKRAGAPGGSPAARDEWEMPVASMAPDPGPLLPLLPADLQALLGAAPLQPVFTTTVRRTTRRLKLADAELEMAFDQGRIEAGGRSLPISEIELELKRGSIAVLFDFARELAETAPLRLSLQSKAERGFALAHDQPPPASRAAPARLEAGGSLDDALAAILRSIFGHLLANQEAAEDGRDPEGVHQVRVALRRLRASLALVGRIAPSPTLDSLRADARWLASALGPARNWDLFTLELLPAIGHALPTLPGFAELARAAADCRAAGLAAAREALAAPRAGAFEIALGAWIERRGWRTEAPAQSLEALAAPALGFAAPLLQRRYRKVLKRGRHFAQLSPEARHSLRLAVKKLRYGVDFFLPLGVGTKSSRRFARRLGKLQELLGAFNDMTTTPERTAEFAVRTLSPSAGEALGAVIGWQVRGLVHLETDLLAAWRRFRRAEPFWSDWPARSDIRSP